MVGTLPTGVGLGAGSGVLTDEEVGADLMTGVGDGGVGFSAEALRTVAELAMGRGAVEPLLAGRLAPPGWDGLVAGMAAIGALTDSHSACHATATGDSNVCEFMK